MKILRELVEEYTNKFDDDATPRLRDFVLKNPKLWMAVLDDEPVLLRMLDQLVRDKRHGERQQVHRLLQGDTPQDKSNRMSGTKRLTVRMKNTLLDWPTFSGKSLRHCTFNDLMNSVSLRREQADDQYAAAAFEATIAEKLPNKRTTVGKALTVDDISAAYAEAYMEAA